MAPNDLESLAMNRTEWRSGCRDSIIQFEVDRVSSLKAKRTLRNAGQVKTLQTSHVTSVGVYADPGLDSTCIVAHTEFLRDQRSVEFWSPDCLEIKTFLSRPHPSEMVSNGISRDCLQTKTCLETISL